MKKRLFIIIMTFALIIVGTGITVFAVSKGNDFGISEQTDPMIIKSIQEAKKYEEVPPIDASDDIYVVEGDKRDFLNDNPVPIFEKNSDISQFYDIDDSIDTEYLSSVGASVLQKRLMTYEEYLNEFDDTSLTSIDSERMIWVVQVSYPNGFETKHGVFMDAVVTGIYDAESGFYFGFNVNGLCKE